MNLKYLILFACICIGLKVQSQDFNLSTNFEQSKGKQTAKNYEEVMQFYEELSKASSTVRIFYVDSTDAEIALPIVVISNDTSLQLQDIRNSSKVKLLLMNGIHPGEPEGIDASMLLARDILFSNTYSNYLNEIILCIIPVYNIEGFNNRSNYYRVNQNGPEMPGFRGNGRNYDLNRDFMKGDARNTKAFYKVFHSVDPDIFIDNHTSNGADYQYTITYIPTQEDKAEPAIAKLMNSYFKPALMEKVARSGYELAPYVNLVGRTPEEGIASFLETARFSTGYTTLFGTVGFVVETHMLKAYEERVKATRAFSDACIEIAVKNRKEIKAMRTEALKNILTMKSYAFNYSLDTSTFSKLEFKGYKSSYKKSEVSGFDRLYYVPDSPITFGIKFFEKYRPKDSVSVPYAYIIPKAYKHIATKLAEQGVLVKQIEQTDTFSAEQYYIKEFETLKYPYEGHYLHYNTQTELKNIKVAPILGDYIVYTNQPAKRLILEALEPRNVDSYFNWNLFDEILSRKEYYSDYLFEDIAAGLLKDNIKLRLSLDNAMLYDEELKNSASKQLDYVYKNSPYSEPSYKRYPVLRILQKLN
jgi:hypothetical protein